MLDRAFCQVGQQRRRHSEACCQRYGAVKLFILHIRASYYIM
jgi:hypothetical protein